MLAKRIIPCLDVTGGRVVKGVNFLELRDAGDPVEIAARYNAQGADELTFLDITATSDGRDLILPIIEAVASQVFIPLTVGGGVRTVADVRRLLNAGADKVSFNSAAIANPQVIRDASARYGAQCIVVAIDAKRRVGSHDDAKRANAGAVGRVGSHDDASANTAPGWDVYSHGGRQNTGLDVLAWARQMAACGAGEILLTSMDKDGTKSGFDLALTRAVSDAVSIPVIASGGVGTLDDLANGIQQGGADAVLAASIFHYGQHTVFEAKRFMAERGIPISTTPGGTSNAPTAELGWALLMMCARDLAKAERLARQGKWHDGIEQMVVLEGKRLGILGLGKLGSRAARYGKAFGMDVVAWSQNLTPEKAAG